MPLPEWTPNTADVAAEIPTRVRDETHRLEDFTTDTKPTKAQVELAIGKAVDDVISAVGTLESCPAESVEDLRESANSLATLGAARKIERQFFSDQIGTDRSPYNALTTEYLEAKKTLIEAVAEACGGGGGESVGSGGVDPAYHFPAPTHWGRAAW